MRVSKHLDLAQPVATRTFNQHPMLQFGFPNEHMMPSGAYRAHWPGKLEVAIAPGFSFIVWRADITHQSPTTRINCDGLLHALALIHNLLDQHNIPLTQRGNVNDQPTPDQGS